MKRVYFAAAAAILLAVGTDVSAPAQNAVPPRQVFTLSSPALTDGGDVPLAYVAEASSTSRCGGGDKSPPLSWSNPPPTTESFALVMLDLDGRRGEGVVHWIAYGMSPKLTALAEGEGNGPSPKFKGGLNNHKEGVYLGPCPGIGDSPHHYLITLFALDLPPEAIPAGLTHEALMAKLKGHVLALSSIVARYGR